MVDRKKRFKPWAAGIALVSILLLGGCLRFGPQEDEMANTANTETEQTQQQTDSAETQTAEESEASSADESASESPESTQSEEAVGSSGDTESTADTTSQSSDEEKKTKNEDEGQRIEVTVSRDDAEQFVEFDLHVLPAGYSLSGMSWEPEIEVPVSADAGENEATGTTADTETGTPADPIAGETDGEAEAEASTTESERVTSTYLDAIIAGQVGTNGFFIDENGQRIGYRYAVDQTGRAGTVRLDFRDGDGGIATWEARITLGFQDVTNSEEEADGGQE